MINQIEIKEILACFDPTKINKLKKAKLNPVKALFITMLLSIKKIKNKNRS